MRAFMEPEHLPRFSLPLLLFAITLAGLLRPPGLPALPVERRLGAQPPKLCLNPFILQSEWHVVPE